jgi:hypothetical protein
MKKRKERRTTSNWQINLSAIHSKIYEKNAWKKI